MCLCVNMSLSLSLSLYIYIYIYIWSRDRWQLDPPLSDAGLEANILVRMLIRHMHQTTYVMNMTHDTLVDKLLRYMTHWLYS